MNKINDLWLKKFAPNLTEKQKEVVSGAKGCFLWHVFFYEFVHCYKADEARKMFDGVDKSNAIKYFFNPGKGVEIDNDGAKKLEINETAESLEGLEFIELYVIDKDFKWCYIITHERDLCGPYFCFSKNI